MAFHNIVATKFKVCNCLKFLAVANNFLLLEVKKKPKPVQAWNCPRAQNKLHDDTAWFEWKWPAQSPDFNPTEHLWDQPDRCLTPRLSHPTSVPDLTNALVTERAQIPTTTFENLVFKKVSYSVVSYKSKEYDQSGVHILFAIWSIFGKHGSAMVSNVTLQQEGCSSYPWVPF